MASSTEKSVGDGVDQVERETPGPFVRTIADDLERFLRNAGTSVHWAQPAGDEVPWEAPKLRWPTEAQLGYAFDESGNEGTQLTVTQLPQLGQEVIPLIQVKFLGRLKSVLAEAVHVVVFLDRLVEAQRRERQQGCAELRVP